MSTRIKVSRDSIALSRSFIIYAPASGPECIRYHLPRPLRLAVPAYDERPNMLSGTEASIRQVLISTGKGSVAPKPLYVRGIVVRIYRRWQLWDIVRKRRACLFLTAFRNRRVRCSAYMLSNFSRTVVTPRCCEAPRIHHAAQK